MFRDLIPLLKLSACGGHISVSCEDPDGQAIFGSYKSPDRLGLTRFRKCAEGRESYGYSIRVQGGNRTGSLGLFEQLVLKKLAGFRGGKGAIRQKRGYKDMGKGPSGPADFLTV